MEVGTYGPVIATTLLTDSDQKRFTILEVATNWRELLPRHIMRPSIVGATEQLDPWKHHPISCKNGLSTACFHSEKSLVTQLTATTYTARHKH